MLRIDQLKLPVGHSEEELIQRLEKILQLKKLGKTGEDPAYSYRMLRKSLDARRKPELFYVYSIEVEVKDDLEERILKNSRGKNVIRYQRKEYTIPEPEGMKEILGRPVITGSGPAGLFCAYILCLKGYSPVILERGEKVEQRTKTVKEFWKSGKLDPESNVQFGEGGAGTFSDGKLNTMVNDKNGRNQFVLNTFVDFGAPSETAFMAKPHLGTDMLANIVRNLREFIIENGGTFMFNTKLTDIETDDSGIRSVNAVSHTKSGDSEQIKLDTNCLILAIGHSARDTFEMLLKKEISMTAKNFAVGLRIQHPQDMINTCQYGPGDHTGLPAADYKLTNRTENGRSVYSFCMCPGGYVVNASSEEGRLAINGMSYSGRDSMNANSAIVVSVDKEDFGSQEVLAGLDYVRALEEKAYKLGDGDVPVQQYGDFKRNTVSSGAGDVIPHIKGRYKLANLRELFDDDINNAIIESIDKFGYTMEGFNRDDAVLSGVESRTSSPVRINRNESFMSNIYGIFPCGEGAGYAGGITSAAMDGIKTAEAVMKQYKPYNSGV